MDLDTEVRGRRFNGGSVVVDNRKLAVECAVCRTLALVPGDSLSRVGLLQNL